MSHGDVADLLGKLDTDGLVTALQEGDLLWQEGDPASEMALLLDGTLEVTHRTPEGNLVLLRLMEAGSVVGEMACCDGSPRSATVRARTACRLLRIRRDRFQELIHRHPEVLERLFWLQVERVRDLTERVASVHDRAITDPLTRLYNRRYLQERLRLEFARAGQVGEPVSLVFFDVDKFKGLNDVHGHAEGDRVLVEVAGLLRATARRGDVVARYGGEEFVALLYGADAREAREFAERARGKVAAFRFLGTGGQPVGPVTVSGGVATFPQDAPDPEGLLAAADKNLYRAKTEGRNRVVPPPPAGAA